ncbi:MAG: redox-sensing transcriptional repressor Rex [Clostridia bacterium]|nr:redox-sensing transcriptional repressor Rex [Clostridia bacterium]
MNKDIPVISLQRLPVYLNYLKTLPEGRKYISSGNIAEALGMGEVLVRKDLAYTSAVGKPRVGYLVTELISALEIFLCCNGKRKAVLVGAGALGRAVLSYGGFKNYGIEICAAFDSDEDKIGLSLADKPVYDIADAETEIKKLGATLAVICVPAQFAQDVADKLTACGIKAILNFAPVLIRTAGGVVVRNIDVAANLAVLSSMI